MVYKKIKNKKNRCPFLKYCLCMEILGIGSIIILEHNGSGTIGLKPIMEPLVLTINSNYQYNLEEKTIIKYFSQILFTWSLLFTYHTKNNYTME